MEMPSFYLEGRTYTVLEVGTLLQRRLNRFYRDRIFDKRPRDRQTWRTQRQHGILTCSLRRLPWASAPWNEESIQPVICPTCRTQRDSRPRR
jgi:hypothetical protein